MCGIILNSIEKGLIVIAGVKAAAHQVVVVVGVGGGGVVADSFQKLVGPGRAIVEEVCS